MNQQETPIIKEKLVYRLKDVDFSLFVRLKNYFSAMHGRKKVFIRFCSKNGISLPIHSDHSYRMPKEYLIEHSRIERFGVIRDRIVVELYRDYKSKMANLENQISIIEDKIRLQKEYLAAERRRLESEKKQLASSKDPLQKIWLESNIDSQSVKIDNQMSVLGRLEGTRDSLIEIRHSNKKTWKRQLEDIEKTMRALTQKFVDRITRKIVVNFHFTDFTYVLPDYNKRVKELLGEDQ